MWPLFCNEVALSYDQEERIRQLQKEIVSNPESWLHRHTGAASEHIIESSHDAITGASEKIEQRSKNLMDVLTPVQKAKYLAWIAKKRKSDHQKITFLSQHFQASVRSSRSRSSLRCSATRPSSCACVCLSSDPPNRIINFSLNFRQDVKVRSYLPICRGLNPVLCLLFYWLGPTRALQVTQTSAAPRRWK